MGSQKSTESKKVEKKNNEQNLKPKEEIKQERKVEPKIQKKEEQKVEKKVQPSNIGMGLKRPTQVKATPTTTTSKLQNANNVSKLNSRPQTEQNQTVRSSIPHKVSPQKTNLKQEVQKKEVTDVEDDEFTEDQLGNSGDLLECQSIHSKQKSTTGSASKGIKQNTIYSQSPSKLNNKFQGQTRNANQIPKQQTVKDSAIKDKKTISNLTQQSKPVGSLDLNLQMKNLTQLTSHQIKDQNLRSINLSNNKIQVLPEEICNLPHLWKLQVDSNLLENLELNFENMKALKMLTVSNNKIKSIPESIEHLADLIEKLDISQNCLEHIPHQIGNLTKLKYLSLQDNRISELPCQLSQLSNLIQFGLEWFAYISPQFEKIIKRSTNKIASDYKNSPLTKTLNIFVNFDQKKHESITFVDFISSYYNIAVLDTLLNQHLIHNQSSIIHIISKNNHYHLFDSLKDMHREIDINNTDKQGETALSIAINEKSYDMIDRILNEFQQQLEFEFKDFKSFHSSETQVKQKHQVSHPLIITVKNQMLNYSLKILKIMIKQHQSSQSSNPLTFNMIDQENNTILHYLFQNFSQNMEQSVQLCQELFKNSQKDGCNFLALNKVNSQGLTPIDVSIEQKQNQALEFAIYYNKNMLPAIKRKKGVNQIFNLNCNKNQKGITPLHRAIISSNYKAIYLLLSSGECDILTKDKDYKSAKEYCQKILFLFKYIKKGEKIYINKFFAKKKLLNKPDQIDQIQNKLQNESKVLTHNNINFFYQSKKQNRVKYNSWYKKIEQKNILANSQQPTIEQKAPEDEDLDSVKLDDMKEGDEIEEEQKIDTNLKESVQSSNQVLHTDQNASTQARRQLQTPTIQSNIKSTSAQKSRASNLSQASQKQSSLMSERKQSTQVQKPQQKDQIDKQKKVSNQHKNSFSLQNKPSTTNNNTHQKTSSRDQNNKIQIQPIINFNALNISQDSTSTYHRGSISLQKEIVTQVENVDEEDDEFMELLLEVDEEESEAQNTLPSNQNKYIMNVNSSHLSRKPYYKQLQKNKFEREFCIMMDPAVPMSQKIQKLYQLYTQIQQNQTIDIQDGKELLGFLKKNTNISLEKGPLPSIQETVVEENQFSAAKPKINVSSRYVEKPEKQSPPKQSNSNIQELTNHNRLSSNPSMKTLDNKNLQRSSIQSMNQPKKETIHKEESSPILPETKNVQSKQKLHNISTSTQQSNKTQKQNTTGLKKPQTQTKESTSKLDLSTNKWKQLTINPQQQKNQTTQKSMIGKGIGKGVTPNRNNVTSKISTPASNKGIPGITKPTQIQSANKSGIKNNAQSQIKGIINQSTDQRSSSNPRNSIISSSVQSKSNSEVKPADQNTSSNMKTKDQASVQNNKLKGVPSTQQSGGGFQSKLKQPVSKPQVNGTKPVSNLKTFRAKK